jgi:hypothetical protein
MTSMGSAIVVLLERPLTQHDARLQHAVEVFAVQLLVRIVPLKRSTKQFCCGWPFSM